MKTEFKTDINGLYLEITPENDNERRLMGELMNDPMRGRRVKMGVRHTTDQRGNQVVRIQGYRYIPGAISEISNRLEVEAISLINGKVVKTGKGKYFAIKIGRKESSGIATGTVKVWRLDGFPKGISTGTLEFSNSNGWEWRLTGNFRGPLMFLGQVQTENELLNALELL